MNENHRDEKKDFVRKLFCPFLEDCFEYEAKRNELKQLNSLLVFDPEYSSERIFKKKVKRIQTHLILISLQTIRIEITRKYQRFKRI